MTDNSSSALIQNNDKAIDSSNSTELLNFSIFIADENEIDRILLQAQLENYSESITLAKDGNQALSLLLQTKYQLILLNLQLPFINGRKLLKLIQKPECINKKTPVIAISTDEQSHNHKQLLENGFVDCLVKPVLIEQLNNVLEPWLANNTLHLKYYLASHNPGNLFVEQMLEKTSNNKELATVLFNKLFKEIPMQTAEIEQALNQSNWVLAIEIIHKLHGSFAFCGLIELQKEAKQVETDLSKKDSINALASFLNLKHHIDQFLKIKDSILQNL